MRLGSTAPDVASPRLAVAAVLLLAACAGPSLRADRPRPEPSHALPPATEGPLAELAEAVLASHGPEHSAFEILDGSHEALRWRLALIDSAVSSLDVQTYLWYPDNCGRLILERAVRAADRGVHVRLIVDDLLTVGQDQLIYELEQHPSIELRLFNPWENRGPLWRAGEMIARMERLNTRMHDKLMIADGNAAIVGGRNIGDHYYGLSHDYNFHDLDLLAIGHLARQANAVFDHFWNSEWVVSAAHLDTEPDPEFAAQRWREIQDKNRAAPELEAVGAEPRDWSAELAELVPGMHPGTSRLVFDTAAGEELDQNVASVMYGFMGQAQRELLITNAYIIPGEPAIEFLRGLTRRGVRTRILTNSLASHDVPAVNSHYGPWRGDLVRAGAELYELRPDPAIGPIVSLVDAEFTGLHTKAVVVDREQVFIGSMNFDPRSFEINAEGGAFVHSAGVAEELAQVMARDMEPDNAWRILLRGDGRIVWVGGGEMHDREPVRQGTQRVMNAIFKLFPRDQF